MDSAATQELWEEPGSAVGAEDTIRTSEPVAVAKTAEEMDTEATATAEEGASTSASIAVNAAMDSAVSHASGESVCKESVLLSGSSMKKIADLADAWITECTTSRSCRHHLENAEQVQIVVSDLRDSNTARPAITAGGVVWKKTGPATAQAASKPSVRSSTNSLRMPKAQDQPTKKPDTAGSNITRSSEVGAAAGSADNKNYCRCNQQDSRYALLKAASQSGPTAGQAARNADTRRIKHMHPSIIVPTAAYSDLCRQKSSGEKALDKMQTPWENKIPNSQPVLDHVPSSNETESSSNHFAGTEDQPQEDLTLAEQDNACPPATISKPIQPTSVADHVSEPQYPILANSMHRNPAHVSFLEQQWPSNALAPLQSLSGVTGNATEHRLDDFNAHALQGFPAPRNFYATGDYYATGLSDTFMDVDTESFSSSYTMDVDMGNAESGYVIDVDEHGVAYTNTPQDTGDTMDISEGDMAEHRLLSPAAGNVCQSTYGATTDDNFSKAEWFIYGQRPNPLHQEQPAPGPVALSHSWYSAHPTQQLLLAPPPSQSAVLLRQSLPGLSMVCGGQSYSVTGVRGGITRGSTPPVQIMSQATNVPEYDPAMPGFAWSRTPTPQEPYRQGDYTSQYNQPGWTVDDGEHQSENTSPANIARNGRDSSSCGNLVVHIQNGPEGTLVLAQAGNGDNANDHGNDDDDADEEEENIVSAIMSYDEDTPQLGIEPDLLADAYSAGLDSLFAGYNQEEVMSTIPVVLPNVSMLMQHALVDYQSQRLQASDLDT
ncbi:hypothetical protein DL89DRAFT_260220 [Linderina pennispora]|uniref:Uncharacterized protein n=1 Tax=Linderina pennispora TaxID=61395 RepID=A0A1Y1VZZ0_9FUNG|nr:uncharacterized protein DL89DRAFT_260220 [Linderina pennispora]ORX66595.1 hypothetical protein DL89DRAFT_260220 [Linderina pennispora]